MEGCDKLDERQMVTIGIVIVFFALFLILVNVLDNKSINGIKAKQVGDGHNNTRIALEDIISIKRLEKDGII